MGGRAAKMYHCCRESRNDVDIEIRGARHDHSWWRQRESYQRFHVGGGSMAGAWWQWQSAFRDDGSCVPCHTSHTSFQHCCGVARQEQGQGTASRRSSDRVSQSNLLKARMLFHQARFRVWSHVVLQLCKHTVGQVCCLIKTSCYSLIKKYNENEYIWNLKIYSIIITESSKATRHKDNTKDKLTLTGILSDGSIQSAPHKLYDFSIPPKVHPKLHANVCWTYIM